MKKIGIYENESPNNPYGDDSRLIELYGNHSLEELSEIIKSYILSGKCYAIEHLQNKNDFIVDFDPSDEDGDKLNTDNGLYGVWIGFRWDSPKRTAECIESEQHHGYPFVQIAGDGSFTIFFKIMRSEITNKLWWVDGNNSEEE